MHSTAFKLAQSILSKRRGLWELALLQGQGGAAGEREDRGRARRGGRLRRAGEGREEPRREQRAPGEGGQPQERKLARA